MIPRIRVALLLSVVVLAGCSFTLGTGSPASPTPSATPGVQQETPNETPTPNTTSTYPPGVDESGLENVSALLEAHTAQLNGTGYVANGSGNTTIMRSGFLVDVTRSIRVVVVNGSQRYFEVRRTHAGPLDRIVQRYSNGSTEFRRHQEDDDVNYRIREPQSAEKLAGIDTVEPFLRGGNFTVIDVREDEDPTTVILRTNETANATALLGGLPENAEQIRSYEALVLVDAEGRVRSMNATVEYVIGGKNRTHTVAFNLTRIGVTNVTEPDWIDDAREREEGGDGQSNSDGSRRGPVDGVRSTVQTATTDERRGPPGTNANLVCR